MLLNMAVRFKWISHTQVRNFDFDNIIIITVKRTARLFPLPKFQLNGSS